jgi:hypothetical protein
VYVRTQSFPSLLRVTIIVLQFPLASLPDLNANSLVFPMNRDEVRRVFGNFRIRITDYDLLKDIELPVSSMAISSFNARIWCPGGSWAERMTRKVRRLEAAGLGRDVSETNSISVAFPTAGHDESSRPSSRPKPSSSPPTRARACPRSPETSTSARACSGPGSRPWPRGATRAFPGQGNQSALEEDLRRLRAENKRLTMERDILKKAMSFFARESS